MKVCISAILATVSTALSLGSFDTQQQIQKINNDDLSSLQQPTALDPPTNIKLRELKWGKINFLHTTDTHAWYAGHLNQENYGADWGDYISFVKHLRDYADSIGVDLIVLDSGDKHDGNGLSDASVINGEVSTNFFVEQDFDLLSIGNHELYLASSSFQEYEIVVDKFQDKYLAANVQILIDDKWVDFGSKYRIFETKNQKLKILSFGFLFNFARFNPQTRVDKVEDVIQEKWFHEVLQENIGKIDMVVIVGHMPVQMVSGFPEISAIHRVIKKYYPDIVINYFGGHSHIRDFSVIDERSVALQSGRYCETVGFLGVDFPETYQSQSAPGIVEFNRRYIDFNLHSFYTHSNKSAETFSTLKGTEITKELDIQREFLNITTVFGYVPNDYLVIDNSYPSEFNLYSFLEEKVLVRLKSEIKEKVEENNSRVVVINTGSIRYDLYKGQFTDDSVYIVSPFQNKWLYLPNVPLSTIRKAIGILNNLDYIMGAADFFDEIQDPYYMLAPLSKMAYNSKLYGIELPIDYSFKNLTKGYVTCDDHGCDGDDTPHIPYSLGKDSSPNIIGSTEIINGNKESLDFVFYDFLKPYITGALNLVNGFEKNYTYDFKQYGGATVGNMLKEHVIENWS
ncbi:hypothetical protein DASC09_051540 [Saccharomycopsis crataegensis]|uniref:Putative 5'-nucleotidase C-terminal domain-containing protein n=1 Tax=Saccharomycopsis crataegensis TaxID=43959 RepID=A0AAV5QTJ7_9ASCO|nr:hypothetical protein DASC09_051540 [Saccharomycopsis crataegensis]